MGWPALAIYGGYLAGKYIYHRLTYEPPEPPKPPDLKVPTTAQGTPVPLLYGRCLVKQPILAWRGNGQAIEVAGLAVESAAQGAKWLYAVDMHFVLGIPFHNGNQTIHAVYAGGYPLFDVGSTSLPGANPLALESLTGDGEYEDTGSGARYARLSSAYEHASIGLVFGNLEFLNGKSTQRLVDGSDTPTTHLSYRMVGAGVPSSQHVGYRGVLSAFLFNDDAIDSPAHREWYIGTDSSPHAYSFDVSTFLQGFAPTHRIGDDCNPVDVIEDILTGGLGKLGLPLTLIDSDSFDAARETLFDEEMGYSRCIDERREASDIINEILEQIDAVLFEDFRDGLDGSIRIKLIRPDYTVSSTPHITPANCEAIENFAITSMSDAVNLVRVVYTDRDNNYAEGEATAMDGAIITASGESPVEAVLRYPGCCTSDQAELIATRELAARGQPIARCSAIVDSTFKDVNPGDAVRVSWPEYHLNERVFRVGQVDRGTFTDGRIRLDLVQDFAYVHRRQVIPGGPVTSFPTSGPLELDPG